MPLDTSRVIPTRRTQKKITDEELRDIEMKRLRGKPFVRGNSASSSPGFDQGSFRAPNVVD